MAQEKKGHWSLSLLRPAIDLIVEGTKAAYGHRVLALGASGVSTAPMASTKDKPSRVWKTAKPGVEVSRPWYWSTSDVRSTHPDAPRHWMVRHAVTAFSHGSPGVVPARRARALSVSPSMA